MEESKQPLCNLFYTLPKEHTLRNKVMKRTGNTWQMCTETSGINFGQILKTTRGVLIPLQIFSTLVHFRYSTSDILKGR